MLVETFVDEARNKGRCYRAAGWTELGRTRGSAKKRGSYVAHGNPKLLFVKCLHPHKTVRGAYDGNKKAPHLLSAVIHQTGVVLAQREVAEKTDEIPEVQNLLQPLPLTGTVVTLDAMHTQGKTAEFIVEDKKADYVFIVKNNQPTLLEEISSLPTEAFSPSSDCRSKRSRSH